MSDRIHWAAVTSIVLTMFAAQGSSGQDTRSGTKITEQKNSTDPPVGYLNWKARTLGGKQFWTDVRSVGDWKIQTHSETGHFRLLDPSSKRNAWGNRLHCDQALDQLIVDGIAKPDSGKIVIVLHGLMRTNSAMQTMADYLTNRGGYTVINFQYASTRNTVQEHAAALGELIDELGPEVTEINFVGHSMGSLVVRRYLHDQGDPVSGQQGDARIKRMVMLAPPNQGSRMARFLKSSFAFQTIAGVSGVELSRGWEKLEPNLATPKFEFGILAGGQKDEEKFSNFILKGKDDFTVSVEETKLPGARDFLVKPWLHSTIMHQSDVLQATLRFLQYGYFVAAGERSPLTAGSHEADTRSGS